MEKWLITDKVHSSAKSQLEAMGFEVDWFPDITNKEVHEIVHQYFGLIISTKTTIDKTLVDKASKLKIVGRVGAGMDHVDGIYCRENGITCFNSPGGNANAVAEHVMGMILGFSKNIFRANNQMRNNEWIRFGNTGFEIKDRTVGIIGVGNTGSRLAKKLSGFDCEILGYDKYKTNFGNEYLKESTVEDIIERAEIISFHVPLTEETRHWINKDFIESCKQKPLIINASRGEVCNTPDLLWALKEQKVRGICLDVFEDEPINKGNVNVYELYQELMEFENVIVSPHIAGWSHEAKKNMVDILMNRIAQFLNKQGVNNQII